MMTIFTNAAHVRVRVINKTDCDTYTTYSEVTKIFEKIDKEATRFYILKMENGETATFPADDWKLAVECFVSLV